MNFGHRLKALRQKNSMTLQQVADVFGITRSAVGSWERGDTRPDPDKLSRLAKLFGTSVEHILTGSVSSGNTQHSSAAPSHRTIGLPVIPIGEAIKWSELMQEEKDQSNTERIPCPFPHSPSAFYTRVSGRSMENPRGPKSYSEGDYIVIDPEREIKNGTVALFDIDGVPTLRQVIIEADGTRMLEALNPAWPATIIALSPQAHAIGAVIGKWVPEE